MALTLDPDIANKVNFVGMCGRVRPAINHNPEYNINQDIPSARAVFTAPWSITITPYETCSQVVLKGEKYQGIRNSRDPLLKAVVKNYNFWAELKGPKYQNDALRQSTKLYDTVAVYLAIAEDFLLVKPLGISIDADGKTVEDGTVKSVRVTTAWSDLIWFEEFLVNRLIGLP